MLSNHSNAAAVGDVAPFGDQALSWRVPFDDAAANRDIAAVSNRAVVSDVASFSDGACP